MRYTISIAIALLCLFSLADAENLPISPNRNKWIRATTSVGSNIAAHTGSPGTIQTVSADPAGDTFGLDADPDPDITSLEAVYGCGALNITITFSAPIIAPFNDPTNGVQGYVDLDTDQNPLTGLNPSNIELFAALIPPFVAPNLRPEFYVDLYSVSSFPGPGSATLFDETLAPVDTVAAVYSGNTITIQIPLSSLGGDDGVVNVAAILGTQFELTDVGPNVGNLTSSASSAPCVPTLGEWALIIMSLAFLSLGTVMLRRYSPGVRVPE